MNKKLISSTIAMMLSYNTLADTTYFTIINPEEDKKGYLTTPTIGLSPFLIKEGDSLKTINIPLTLSDDLPTNSSIKYTVSHVSTNNDDLEIQTGIINLNKRDSSYLIPVEIKGDYLIENNKEFNVTLSNPNFLILSESNSSRNYTLEDNDTIPSLSIQDLTVTESDIDSVVDVTILLSRPSSLPFSVNYSMVAVSASGEDFVLDSGILYISKNQPSKKLSVTIKGDNLDEDNETFKIVLSNPIDSTIDKSTALVTIDNDDAPPTITLVNESFLEGDEDEILQIPIKLSNNSEKNVTVDYELVTGTADENDFVTSTGTLTFLAGETISNININVLSDYKMEDNETFTVNLKNPINVELKNTSMEITLDNDDSEYEFNTLPLYGKIEYLDNGSWVNVIANNGYERDAQFRYNPTELEVLAVSQDIKVGFFDTDTSTSAIDGNYDLSEWGVVTGNTGIYTKDETTITTTISHGNIAHNTGYNALGSDAFTHANPATNYYEIESPMIFTIALDGDFLNDVSITATGIGGCFEITAGNCQTKIVIDAYDAENNLISSQGGYRQSGKSIDTYSFTGTTPIKTFKIYPTPTNEGGLNPLLSSGNFALSNMIVSRSAFEVIDYKYTDIDDSISTERINLNINEGNANINVDVNQYLLNQ